MIELLFKNYKSFIYLAIVGALVTIIFFAGVGFSKSAADLKVANANLKISGLITLHQTQLQLIKDANQLALDERQAHINHLQLEFAKADKDYLEKINDVKRENDRITECFKSGKCVQRVKIQTPVCGAQGKDSNPQDPNGSTYAELDRQVTVDARRITDEGNEIITGCNLLKDKIEACVAAGLCPFVFI